MLQKVQTNNLDIDQAFELLRDLPYQDLEFAKIDHHRPIRTGAAEVVMGKGKTPEQVAMIVEALGGRGHPVLVTKTDATTYEAVLGRAPTAIFHEMAGVIVVPEREPESQVGEVLVISGDAGDLPIAEETVITAGLMGNQVSHIKDAGPGGVQSIIDQLPALRAANVVVVVAGTDSALAGVVAGLVAAPVVAVPTSAGFGASFEGLAPLLTMLNSCAPGVAVVNIDNGFGAGYLASQINHMATTKP